jgi:hypothetical protein
MTWSCCLRSWKLETGTRPIRFGEKDTRESLLDLGGHMLEDSIGARSRGSRS